MENKLISLPITITGDTRFRDIVIETVGEKILSCYQCYKCSAGCPVAFAMDILPHQIIRAVLLLQKEKILSSRTIWLCASCETCTTRCPNEIDVAKVMDVLRQMQVESGTKPKESKAPIFHNAFISTIKSYGRIHEVSLLINFLRQAGIAGDKLRTGEWKNDLRLGIKLFLRGKLKLIPSFLKEGKEVKKIFDQAQEFKKL
ncbi:MAG: 4Fe-4S dicluster domain-containing protein [Desulfobacterota bacterium]|nr:4Fe-4S dicluster domain-containing protein [Thermodesulfobacteriota bacterium]